MIFIDFFFKKKVKYFLYNSVLDILSLKVICTLRALMTELSEMRIVYESIVYFIVPSKYT